MTNTDDAMDVPPSTSEDDRLNLANWNLPSRVVDCYMAQGINRMFPWQADCLLSPGVLDRSVNLVYSAPTSAGKTFVAELLVLKRLLERKCKGLIILPFVSLAREKMLSLQKTFRRAGLKVEGYMGTMVPPPGGIDRWDVAVCTLEKANSLINRLIEDQQIDKIGSVVVDELHTVADPSRGYLLELLLSKLSFLSRSRDNIDIQIIGMSATVSNVHLLAEWLNAKLYTTTFRPVPLTERLLLGDELKDCDLRTVGLVSEEIRLPNDPEHVISLCLETVLGRHGVLLFCCSRSHTEKLAENIARIVHQVGVTKEDPMCDVLRAVFNQQDMAAYIAEFKKNTDAVTDTPLIRLLRYGVAFHHAGLTMEEREGVERGFRLGCVRVVVATSTLSAGVNLPAKRVIIRSPWGNPSRPGPCLTPAVYKQMVGRAGRKGIDTSGESILICKQNELERGHELMTAPIAPVASTLLNDDGHLSHSIKRALLETIAGRMATTQASLMSYVNSTLLGASMRLTSSDNADTDASNDGASQQMQSNLQTAVTNCIQYYVDHDFIAVNDDTLEVTQLGSAAVASALGPDLTLTVYEDLVHARRSIVLENDLHLVFLVTPVFMLDWGTNFSWSAYHDLWCRLPADLARVGSLIGINERYLVLRSNQRQPGSDVMRRAGFSARDQDVHMRFYTALALHDLVNEQPLRVVADRFGCARGFLQQLQQNASSFAGMVVTLCERLGWSHMHQLLSGFAERLAFGIRRDLTELVRIDGIDGLRARCFHADGYKTLASVAAADISTIQSILAKAVPFEQCTDGANAMRGWLVGHPEMTLTEAATVVQGRALNLLHTTLAQLGIQNVDAVAALPRQRSRRRGRRKKRLVKVHRRAPNADQIVAALHNSGDVMNNSNSNNTVNNHNNSHSLSTLHNSSSQTEASTSNVDSGRYDQSSSTATGMANLTSESEQYAAGTSGHEMLLGDTPRRHRDACRQGTHITTTGSSTSSQHDSGGRRRRSLGLTTPTKITPADNISLRLRSHAATTSVDSPVFAISSQVHDMNNSNNVTVTTNNNNYNRSSIRRQEQGALAISPVIANLRRSGAKAKTNSPRSNGTLLNDSLDNLLLDDSQVVNVQRCYVLHDDHSKTTATQLANNENLTPLSNSHCAASPPIPIVVPRPRPAPLSPIENIMSSPVNNNNINSINNNSDASGKTLKLTKSATAPLNSTTICPNDSVNNFDDSIDDILLNISHISISPNNNSNSRNRRSSIQLQQPSVAHSVSHCDNQKAAAAIWLNRSLNRSRTHGQRTASSDDLFMSSDDENVAASSTAHVSHEDMFDDDVSTSDGKALSMPDALPASSTALTELKRTHDQVPHSSPASRLSPVVKRNKIVSMPSTTSDHVSSPSLPSAYIMNVDVKRFMNDIKVNRYNVGEDLSVMQEALNRDLHTTDNHLSICTHVSSSTRVTTKSRIGSRFIESMATEAAAASSHSMVIWLCAGPGSVHSINGDCHEAAVTEAVKLLSRLALNRPVLNVICFGALEKLDSMLMAAGIDCLPSNMRLSCCQSLAWLHASDQLPVNAIKLLFKTQAYFSNREQQLLTSPVNATSGHEFCWLLAHKLYPFLYQSVFRAHSTAFISYNTLVLPVIPVISCMRWHGIQLDVSTARSMRNTLQQCMITLEHKAHRLAGHPFSLSSPSQIARVLFGELRLNCPTSLTGSAKKHLSTNKQVLQALSDMHALPSIILDWRQVENALSTAVMPLMQAADRMGVVRAHSDCFTSTGRIASHSPNLHCIPKVFSIGSQPKQTFAVRSLIIPPTGHLIISADYCQLELRVLAHLCGDSMLVKTINEADNNGLDVFKCMAATWLSTDIDHITDEQRAHVKQIFYGIIYGMGVSSLALQLKVDVDRATQLMASFKSSYPGIFDWIERSLGESDDKTGTGGMVVTSIGGRRRCVGDWNRNRQACASSAVERRAVNTLVQSSAADLFRCAIVQVHHRLKHTFADCAHLVLQVHDELLVYVKTDRVNDVSSMIASSMVDAGPTKLRVPLKVRVSVGENWAALKQIQLE